MDMNSNTGAEMTSRAVAFRRIANQQMAGTHFMRPADLVQWMGCMQAGDYGMAKWAIGCRLKGISDASVEQDLGDGKILRTHVLGPAWHFVCPADIRWMLKWSAPRIKAMSRTCHEKLGIDYAILRQSKRILTKALTKHRWLTCEELTSVLRREKINVNDSRVGHLLMDAELDALICSAGRTGGKFCYQLLDEAVPVSGPTGLPGYEESLAELAKRYFFSRGPASVRDFAWWGNLTMPEAKKGLEMNKRELQHASVNGNDYWFAATSPTELLPGHSAVLLPAFDEYMVAYRNRNHVLDLRRARECDFGLAPVIVYNGRVAGVWRRAEKKEGGRIELRFFEGTATPTRTRAVAAAARRYLAFAGGDSEYPQ
jgi:hypothetical protein